VRRAGVRRACAIVGGTLSKADLHQRFASPLIVGERDARLPVRPLFRQDGTNVPPVGHVHERTRCGSPSPAAAARSPACKSARPEPPCHAAARPCSNL